MAGADLDLMRGTLDLLVLRSVTASPQHGFGIGQWIRAVTQDDLRVEDGALYTSLHRLERRGLLRARWAITEKNRKAKYYELTSAGRQALRKETVRFERYARAVFTVLEIV